jgi:Bacterial regulatory helix-turn-helix protein, lysR family
MTVQSGKAVSAWDMVVTAPRIRAADSGRKSAGRFIVSLLCGTRNRAPEIDTAAGPDIQNFDFKTPFMADTDEAMDLQQPKHARPLAELGSSFPTADTCNVTRPTLSNDIAALEQELGHHPFERTTRVVLLTEACYLRLPDNCDLLNAQTAKKRWSSCPSATHAGGIAPSPMSD